VPADDPTERFDLCDEEGRPLGVSKPRALVHRDGDWHRSLHVWVILASQAGHEVVLQRRSLSKDSHPGRVDVSVAGHLREGESVATALREAEEEIGLRVGPADVVRLGQRRRVDVRPPDQVDREVQEILLVVTPRPLESLRPDPDEVLGLVAVPVDDAAALFAGRVAEVVARELRADGAVTRGVVLRQGELLPAPDGYFARVIGSIQRRLAGGAEAGWVMGPG